MFPHNAVPLSQYALRLLEQQPCCHVTRWLSLWLLRFAALFASRQLDPFTNAQSVFSEHLQTGNMEQVGATAAL
jgi:hypothetical protein